MKRHLVRVLPATVVLLLLGGLLGIRLDSVTAQETVIDPGDPGPYINISTQQYDDPNGYMPSGYPFRVEMRGDIYYPADLSHGPLPLIILLHGQHQWCHDGIHPNPDRSGHWLGVSPWCPPDYPYFIDSYRGYDYLARNLASHGYLVESISANGVNAASNTRIDAGALARAELIDQHLLLWNQWNNGQGRWLQHRPDSE